MVAFCTNGYRKTKGTKISYHRLPVGPLRSIWLRKTHAVKDTRSSAASTSAQIATKMKEKLSLDLVKKAEN